MSAISNRLFLDTETDGVRAGRRVWDIGMVRYDGEGNREQWSIIVEDIDLGEAEPASLSFGNFKRRHPLAGGEPERGTSVLTEADAAELIFKVTYGTNPGGIVANFDTEALDAMLRRQGFCWTAWHHLVCAENRALGALETHALYTPEVAAAHPQLLEQARSGRWSTDDIAAAFGVVLPEQMRHTAIGDAILAEMMILASTVDHVVPVPGAKWEPPPAIKEYFHLSWRATQNDLVLT
jgi:hypothetical protein